MKIREIVYAFLFMIVCVMAFFFIYKVLNIFYFHFFFNIRWKLKAFEIKSCREDTRLAKQTSSSPISHKICFLPSRVEPSPPLIACHELELLNSAFQPILSIPNFPKLGLFTPLVVLHVKPIFFFFFLGKNGFGTTKE
jgi:hypothetical protein